MTHVVWRVGAKDHLATSARIIEMQRACMQHLPCRTGSFTPTINRIGQKRVPQAGQMHPNLMRSARFQSTDNLADGLSSRGAPLP